MKKRIPVLTACLLALSLLLAGCGAGRKSAETTYSGPNSGAVPGEAYDSSPRQDAGFYGSEQYEKPAEQTNEAKHASEATSEQSSAADGRKLVKTMSFSIETQDFDKSTAEITFMVNRLGGYVENANVSGNSSRRYDTRTATYVLRIPVASLAEFENGVGGIGNVTSRTEQVKDITLTYADTASRLKSLETQRDSLIEMMGKAEKLEDLLTIQDHLANVEYELESYASRLRLYDNQVEYSSVSIKLSEVKVYTEPEPDPETFGERIAAAFREGLEGAGEFFKDLIVFLAGSLPVLLVFAAVIALIVMLIRKAAKKRRARRAAAVKPQVSAPRAADDGNTGKN